MYRALFKGAILSVSIVQTTRPLTVKLENVHAKANQIVAQKFVDLIDQSDKTRCGNDGIHDYTT